MKKVIMLFSILAMVMIALVPSARPVSAQNFPGYTTGTQVMNLGSASAVVTLEYYSADDGTTTGGTVVDTKADVNIDSFKSATFFPTLTSFKGSMVISSSQPLGAVTNLQNSTATASAAYVGASTGATTVQLPLLMKNNGSNPYSTWMSVQNAGSAVANISIKYSDCTNPILDTVKPGASKTISQQKEACHGEVAGTTGKVFSGQITSDQPIVVVVVEENTAKLLAYNGFPAGTGDLSADLVMPLVNANNSGISTGIQIVNTGDVDTTVTVSYTPSSASYTACTETQDIKKGSSATFALIAFSANQGTLNTTCAASAKFVGTGKVTQNTGAVNLVGIVNQTKTTYGEAYGAFNPAKGTPIVVMPLLMDRNGKNAYSTGFSVMNAGGSDVYVKCSLTNLPAGVTYAPEGLLTPGKALTYSQTAAIGIGYVGSGTCTAYTAADHAVVDTAAQLVGIVNELGATTADRLLVYEALNITPAP